ncbi:MAG: SRPBCC domain-containing protein [Jiangellaceae bacterium]
MLEELAAIHRTVVRDDGGGTVSVTLSRTYDADAEDVWDALTNPERLPRWFYPISGDLKVGGSFQFEGNAGGEIRQCDRPTRLQATFGGPDSILDVRLSGTRDKTTVEGPGPATRPRSSSPTRCRWRWPAAALVRCSSDRGGTVPCSGSASTCAA